MADNIFLKSGNKAGMPALPDRMPAFVRDEKALYIGTPDGNLKLCSAETEGKVKALEKRVLTMEESMDNKLSAIAAEAVADVASDAEAAESAAKVNEIISAMKASGLMNI